MRARALLLPVVIFLVVANGVLADGETDADTADERAKDLEAMLQLTNLQLRTLSNNDGMLRYFVRESADDLLAAGNWSSTLPGILSENTLTAEQLSVKQQQVSSIKPLLMVAGWPFSWRSYLRLVPLIDPRARVVLVELRGYGESTFNSTSFYNSTNELTKSPRNPYALGCAADDVLVVASHEAVTGVDGKFNIMGFGFGGSAVAGIVAAKAPKLVESVIVASMPFNQSLAAHAAGLLSATAKLTISFDQRHASVQAGKRARDATPPAKWADALFTPLATQQVGRVGSGNALPAWFDYAMRTDLRAQSLATWELGLYAALDAPVSPALVDFYRANLTYAFDKSKNTSAPMSFPESLDLSASTSSPASSSSSLNGKEVLCPVLVLFGEADAWLGKPLQASSFFSGPAISVPIKNAGYGLIWDNPRQSALAINAFLAPLVPRTPLHASDDVDSLPLVRIYDQATE